MTQEEKDLVDRILEQVRTFSKKFREPERRANLAWFLKW